MVNYKKVAILLTCFTVVFAKNDTAIDDAIGVLDTVVKDQGNKTTEKPSSNAAPTTSSKADSTTSSKAATTAKTTSTKTEAPANTTCGSCEKVNLNGCDWNQVEESKTDFHYDTIGNCPCPDDIKKDRCHVVKRNIRSIPALQAWSASLFLLSICIAGLYFCFWMVNISPLNIPPYNKYVFIIAVLLLLICITSWVGMSPAVTPSGPPIASIMNVFTDLIDPDDAYICVQYLPRFYELLKTFKSFGLVTLGFAALIGYGARTNVV